MQKQVLSVLLPRSRESALKWVFGFVFGDDTRQLRFDLHDTDQILFRAGDRTVAFASVFPDLTAKREDWPRQMPSEPLPRFSEATIRDFTLPQPEGEVPTLFGRAELAQTQDSIRMEADLFGGLFFLLSRFEEIVSSERDMHDRFPGKASLAHRAGFLAQPLADVYRHIIRRLIARMWPSWTMAEETPKPMQVSCDVDEPFDNSASNLYRLIRSLGADLLHRHSPGLAVRRGLNYALRGLVGPRFDPCYTFDWYMDVCEAQNLKATFYFIAGHSAGKIDGTYRIDEPRILSLLRKISERGHHIGMHGSYNTFRDASQLTLERAALNKALERAGVSLEVTENRQHYLRWDTSCTPENLVRAGFKSDSTGGFADLPGFRYGTARPFKMWSWHDLRPLDLIQTPLIVMEGTLLSDLYMNLDFKKAAHQIEALQTASGQFGGAFSLLWHNSELKGKNQRTAFLNACSGRKHGARPT